MLKFFEIGVQWQRDSMSTPEANHRFYKSCKACADKGLCGDCDHCPIRGAHRFMLETFALKQEVEQEIALRKMQQRIAVPVRG